MLDLNKTIILLALFGYEMIIANSVLFATLVIYHSYPTCARGIIVPYFQTYLRYFHHTRVLLTTVSLGRSINFFFVKKCP